MRKGEKRAVGSGSALTACSVPYKSVQNLNISDYRKDSGHSESSYSSSPLLSQHPQPWGRSVTSAFIYSSGVWCNLYILPNFKEV